VSPAPGKTGVALWQFADLARQSDGELQAQPLGRSEKVMSVPAARQSRRFAAVSPRWFLNAVRSRLTGSASDRINAFCIPQSAFCRMQTEEFAPMRRLFRWYSSGMQSAAL